METTIPRRRRARVLSLGAAIALVALLLPATAGIALGHVATKACDQIFNDPNPDYGTAIAHLYGTDETFTIPASTSTAVGVATVPSGSYWVVWPADGFYQGHPYDEVVTTDNEDDPTPIVVGPCTPSISTVASPSTGRVGVAMTVGDTATLDAPFTFVPETLVTFTLYSDSECTTPTGVTGSGALNGSGVATYSQSWTPAAAGTYYWKASFPGDAYNTGVAPCGGETETVVVSSPPTSPPCTAANNCYFNTPTPPVVTPTPPVVTPTPPVVTPTPAPTSAVEAATSRPHITPPPTSSLGGGTPGGPASGTWLVLLALAGLLGSILLLTPVPARARHKR